MPQENKISCTKKGTSCLSGRRKMEQSRNESTAFVLKIKQLCGAKWTGEVRVSLQDPTAKLKSQLFELTGQPIHTMKLMCSGK